MVKVLDNLPNPELQAELDLETNAQGKNLHLEGLSGTAPTDVVADGALRPLEHERISEILLTLLRIMSIDEEAPPEPPIAPPPPKSKKKSTKAKTTKSDVPDAEKKPGRRKALLSTYEPDKRLDSW
jgi:hypothetical protein